jgi:hypothetical protein
MWKHDVNSLQAAEDLTFSVIGQLETLNNLNNLFVSSGFRGVSATWIFMPVDLT